MSVPFMQGQLILDAIQTLAGGGGDWIMNNAGIYTLISSAAVSTYLRYAYTPPEDCIMTIDLKVAMSSAVVNQEVYLDVYEGNTGTVMGRTINRMHATATVKESFYCSGRMVLTADTVYDFQCRLNHSAAGNQTVYMDVNMTQMYLKARANP